MITEIWNVTHKFVRSYHDVHILSPFFIINIDHKNVGYSHLLFRIILEYLPLTYLPCNFISSVDATAESPYLGRLLNHSRLDNNCQTKVVDINNRPFLILVASRDIKQGEELLYDYGDRSKDAVEAHPWLKSWWKWFY